MTQAASTHVEPIIKRARNSPDLRICFKSTRAVSTIQKMPDGKYKVVKLYDGEVSECNKYSEAKQAASSAAMMPAPAATANGTPDLVVCYKSDRAISTIQKMADGRWMVVKLYEEKAAEFDTFWVAEQVATNAAMTQAPRTKKDAA